MFHTSKKRAGKRLADKGQFTLFVIVGLLIFFAFAFALYARVKVVTSMTSVQADVQIKSYINQNSIDQYVTSCLDAVSDDIFVNAAMQGGTLNFTDKSNNSDYIEYFDPNYNRTFNVSIVVKPNDVCRPNPGLGDNYLVTQEAGPYPSRCNVPDRVPNMPSAYVNLAPGPCRNSCFGKDFFLYSGFFGINDLPMLCDPNGANSYKLSQGVGAILSCDYYDNYGKSMQQILEEEITREINKCVNISAILEKVPSNITQIGEVNTSIIFKYGGYIIKLQYPITVTVRNSQPVTRLVDFEIKRDIQYKEVYEYAYELINNDIKKPEFEIFRDMRKVVGMSSRRRNQTIYSDNLRVNVIPGRPENNWVNIVQVTDTNRTILGHNVTLTFAVANRRPVLDYINSGESLLYDIAVSTDQDIDLTPRGYDPDDETVTYSYNGWQQDRVDAYDWVRCPNFDSNDINSWECTSPNLSYNSPPMKWTSSPQFISNGRDATYHTNPSDIGFHTVTISIYDRGSLVDYQDVRILVFDMPDAIIKASNDYADIPDNEASLEDQYLLNGAESTVGAFASSLIQIRSMQWQDFAELFDIIKYMDLTLTIGPIAEKQLRIPQELTVDPVDIMNIKNYNFSIIGNHVIKLTVNDTQERTSSENYNVNVSMCLPHRDTVNNRPPYPFDLLTNPSASLYDHLQADHTCCNSDYTYADADTICYQKTMYGEYSHLTDYKALPDIRYYDIQTQEQNGLFINNVVGTIYDNDVFQQDFTSRCSNDRGNVCTGIVTETRTRIDGIVGDCQDDNGIRDMWWGGPDTRFNAAKCSGPGYTASPSNNIITCVDYSSNQLGARSYQEVFYGGNYICTSEKQPSDGIHFQAYNNSVLPKYSCDGLCDGGQCNTATGCTCNSAYASDPNIAHPDCDGTPYNTGKRLFPATCNHAGETYFEDMCDNNCALMDVIGVCRANSTTPLVTGCDTDLVCDNHPPGYIPSQIVCALTSPTRRATCGSTCKLETDWSDRTCRGPSYHSSCYADPECENSDRNSIIEDSVSNPYFNRYCDNECVPQTCPDYFAYDNANSQCFNYPCVNNGNCATNSYCDGFACVPY